jgi:hypothetical protein
VWQVKGNYNVAVAKSAIKEGSAMQKRVEGTVAVVFVFFVIRAVYASMFAASFALYDLNPACSECGPCQTTLTVMGVWFISNPGARELMAGKFCGVTGQVNNKLQCVLTVAQVFTRCLICCRSL